MKCKYSVLFLIVFLVTFTGLAKRTTKHPVEKIVDVSAVIDSAMIMADDYADAVISKPAEIAKARMNRLYKFYLSQPQQTQDSISERMFDLYATFIETGQDQRAIAFKDCFLFMAGDSHPKLGPLYATELAIAQEHVDTTRIKTYLPLLIEYSNRLNFDYDDVITTATNFIQEIRTQRPINESIQGVWVGETICDIETYIPSFVEAFITDIDGNKEKYMIEKTSLEILFITTKSIIASGDVNVKYVDFPYVGYDVPLYEEVMKKYKKGKSYIFGTLSKPSWLYKESYYSVHPQHVQYDEVSRSAYAIWSSGDISSFNPDYFAMLRQDMQHDYAYTAGNLSRSHVSQGTRFKGGLVMDGLYRVGNSILDRLAVSTAYFWIKELTLTMTSSNSLRVWTHLQYNISKSNSNSVKTKEDNQDGILYCKWTPEDNVFFLGYDIISLGELTKSQKKNYKKIIKEKKDEFCKTYGNIGSSTKKNDEFKRFFNTFMFNKLKNKDQ